MLLWLPRIVVACVERQALTAQEAKPGAIAELLLFPRYHLDMGSLLARHPLSQVLVSECDSLLSLTVTPNCPGGRCLNLLCATCDQGVVVQR